MLMVDIAKNSDLNHFGPYAAIVKSFLPNKAPEPDGITYRSQQVRHAYNQHMQRHATPAPLPLPMEAGGRSDDTEARIRAQHHSPSAAPRRTHKRRLQPTGMHRSGIPRRRQSLRLGLAPGPTTEDAPSRHLQGNGQAHSLLSPQEDLPSQAGRTAVHHEEYMILILTICYQL
ncbi:hypothetical protein Trydic_g15518 [Trypoxylus dichotomus]